MSSPTYAERIRESRPRLSKSFKRLADYIMDSYIQAALMTTSELAHQVNVDAATVVRFAQALNYSGFPELQDEIKSKVLEDLHLQPQDPDEIDNISTLAESSLAEFSTAIDRARRLLDSSSFAELIAAIISSKRVLIMVAKNIEPLAQHFAHQLRSFGNLATSIIMEEENLAEALAATEENDFALAVDMDGKSALMPAGLAQAKSFGLTTGAIVGGASFETARKVDIVLEVHSHEQGEAGFLVMASFLETIIQMLRWQQADQYKEHLARVQKARRRFAKAA